MSAGGNDLDQSGNLGNVTSYTIYNLPGGGATIYVRLLVCWRTAVVQRLHLHLKLGAVKKGNQS